MTTLRGAASRFVQSRLPAGSHARVVVGSSAVQLAAAGTSALLAVLTQLLIARWIGPDEFGHYAYLLSWINIFALAGTLGFDTASLRFVAEYRALGQWQTLRGYMLRSLRLPVAVAGVVAVIGAGVHWRLTNASGAALWAIAAGGVLLPTLVYLKITASHLQAMHHAVVGAVTQGVTRPLALVGLLAMFVLFGTPALNAGTVMIANLIATGFSVAICVAWSRRIFPVEVKVALPEYDTRRWFATATPLLAITVSQGLLLSADTLMIGLYRGTREAGLYSVAAQIVTVVTLGISAANAIVAPMLAELYAKRDLETMRHVLKVSARSVLAYAIPVLIVLVLFGEQILLLYGPEFRASWLPMMILAVGQLSIVLFGSVGFLLTMSGNERTASRTIVASAVLNVALNAALIPVWGVVGAAIATGVSTIVRSAILTVAARRLLSISATAF